MTAPVREPHHRLENRCVWFVARKMAEPHVPPIECAPDSFPTEDQLQARFNHWRQLTVNAIPKAVEVINGMDNLNLLKLIGDVIAEKEV